MGMQRSSWSVGRTGLGRQGRTVAIEVRWAEGRNERIAEIAADFVQRKADVIVAAGTAPVLTVKRATATIPIVGAILGEPVGTGLVTSLASTRRKHHGIVARGARPVRQAA